MLLPHVLDRTILIRATADTVFGYFTDSARWASWWGAGSSIDPRPGGPLVIRYPDGTEVLGEVLDMSKPSVEAIREQVKRILTEPSFTAGAGRLQTDLLASPSPADIVPVLEKLAGIQ